MKQVKVEMKAVLRDLKQLTKKAERIATKLDKLEKASKAKPKTKKAPAKKTTKAKAVAKKKAPAKKKAVAKKKAPAKKKAVAKKKAPVKKRPVAKKKAPAKKKPVAKKAKKMSASDTILKIIKSRKTPIDTASLKKRTGFKDNNIRMIVYRLKKRGEIKSVRKGVYQRA